MIKILHTSDWHLGHTLYSYDRTEEQQSMLSQIEDIVREHQPDAMLICGDIYHTAQPSSAVQTMFTEAIVRMHEACPAMTMVITAGNHDSGTRHEIFKEPWRALKVHVVGNLEKGNPESHLIKIEDKGYIIAVPYSSERNIPDGWFQNLLDIAAEHNTSGLPVIMSAHTTVSGCDFTGHDNVTGYTVGGIDSLDISHMGTGYDYLALGHIHNAQFVQGGEHRIRYSGTPLSVSFDENFSHSISMVEIDSHGSRPRVQTIDIQDIHPLVTLPAEGYASWQEAKELLNGFPDDIQAYIRLNVETDDFLPPEANDEAMMLCKGKVCRFCYINAIRKGRHESKARVLTVQEFRSEKPIDIARRYTDDTGQRFDGEMEILFNEIIEMVNEESRNV
ncbi:MAG: exonuclease subunit SbcD [Bacteroides sp.]|nr:exonuclease subunit SbcD [Bacteroides sp.]